MRFLKFGLALGLSFILVGCCTVPEEDAVTQERALTNIVKKRDLKYTQADPNLSEAQKLDVIDFWNGWESYLQNRERQVREK